MLFMLTLITEMITSMEYDQAQIERIFTDLVSGDTTLDDICNGVSTENRESFYRSLPEWKSVYYEIKLIIDANAE